MHSNDIKGGTYLWVLYKLQSFLFVFIQFSVCIDLAFCLYLSSFLFVLIQFSVCIDLVFCLY